MDQGIVIQQMGMIVILVAIGFYLYKRKIVDDRMSQKLSVIVIDICNPAMILSSMLSGQINVSHKELLIALGIGAAFYLLLVLLGFAIPRLLRLEKDKRRFYNMMTVYTNVGFIGLPVARTILPEDAMVYVVVCNVMYALLFYTHGVSVLSSGKEKINLKKVLSPGTIAAVLGLLVCWFRFTPPTIITSTVGYIGNATVFLSMSLLGISIARSNVGKGLKDIRLWIFVVLRLILLPFAVFFTLRALGMDPMLVLGFSLMAMMPVGNLPLIQAEKTGEETETLSNGITITTLVSMVSITVLMMLFMSFE
jgi:predicted permease